MSNSRTKQHAQPDRTFIRILIAALRSIGTPRALGIYLLLVNREWDQLAAIAAAPHQYLDTPTGVKRYWDDARASALVRKYPWPTSFSRKKAAEETFDLCEAQCAETNYLLQCVHLELASEDPASTALRDILVRAKKLCTRILGPVPAMLFGRFGTGTVYELERSPFATLADKVSNNSPHLTPASEEIFDLLYGDTLWRRSRSQAGLPYRSFVRGNRFTTVPKDGSTDRGICVEPSGNIWMQLAVGDYLKDRLAGVGIRIAGQPATTDPIELLRRTLWPRVTVAQDTHRRLAEEASRNGSLATLDLKNASDTVCRELVRAILPSDWHMLLDCLRSPFTRRNGKWVKLEKFSSMGNGFTFELETLLFACIIHGVRPELLPGRDYHVYGDDIIIPTAAFLDVACALQACGFTPNRKKSFSTGFFRESCGGDFFCGFNVRPFFLKDEPRTPLDFITLHNDLRRSGIRLPASLFNDVVPAAFRKYGPARVDGVFWGYPREKWGVFTKRNTPHVSWIKRVTPIPLRLPLDRWAEWSHLLLALLGVPSSGITPNRQVRGFKLTSFSVS